MVRGQRSPLAGHDREDERRSVDLVHPEVVVKTITSEGAVYGQTYYCVEPVVGNVKWVWHEMEAWIRDTMGPSTGYIWGENPAPQPGERWYANSAKFWFRDEQDRVLFLLRWS